MHNTTKYNLLKIILLLLLSTNLFGSGLLVADTEVKNQQNDQTTSSDTQTDETNTTNEVDPYDLGFIIKLIQNKNFKLHTDNQIGKIDDEMEKIVKNINKEIPYTFDEKDYEQKTKFLNSKINVNSKYDNNLAVSRDLLKITILENQKNFAQTINSIIDGKNSFKDKKYYVSLLDDSIEKLTNIDLSIFKKTASQVSDLHDTLSTDFKTSLNTLESQIKANLLVFNYLKANMNEYRPSNFILDELSLKYVIKKIDSTSYIKNTSEIFDYYFHISIGKIVILIFVFILFFIANKKILPFFASLFSKKLSKKIKALNISIIDIVPSSFSFSVSILMYIFALQLSLFLLIDNASIVNKLVPWFTTVYLALLSYMFYRILTNYINLSSDKIFNDYPNMRKEMVDFILRILKILILICLLLFLLVQLDFDIKAIIASLGIGGIAVALAAKDTLSNFFGSLNIITDNSFSQGDWIEAGNVEGTVVDIRMRTTRIRTFANAMITVPNAQLANMSILNWSKRVIGRRIMMSLGITYGSKMSDIENLVVDIREMLQEHPSIASSKLNIDKKPYLLKKEDLIGVKNTTLVYIDEYASSSINILVYCFSRSPDWEDWLETKQDVIVKISQLVAKNNCSFAFPTQTIHLEKTN
ncbi:mechanosensitive ion channel family protein [Arcobacter sp. KX21116]|jgi:MscS family membrane protein|uniref:mechanosensitive ion channel family protein n=1 Tax=Arcobacter iocasae TaxID=2906515 RepID=UPI0035D47218|tara:strand:- start:31456 stop:33378 length:1923 start_codon:yes stop_codon:yes gene_type:complete